MRIPLRLRGPISNIQLSGSAHVIQPSDRHSDGRSLALLDVCYGLGYYLRHFRDEFVDRRGWLDDLEGDARARAAFRYQEWNRYRIECVGPTIKAWVNGVPTTDFVDHLDAEGVIGLQVHKGNDTRVRWRNFRLQGLSGGRARRR